MDAPPPAATFTCSSPFFFVGRSLLVASPSRYGVNSPSLFTAPLLSPPLLFRLCSRRLCLPSMCASLAVILCDVWSILHSAPVSDLCAAGVPHCRHLAACFGLDRIQRPKMRISYPIRSDKKCADRIEKSAISDPMHP
ncbi:hypothetical protein PIB30_062725 [Stylosanthes scabra]|uniref:Uncharacterized protein n=1 Tax=Stylosanthes scabra TaxID=79078 RepID=A0ABU6VKT3_9FABA|nr:hypothetical protein [Stylosanthes scabra]